MQFDRAVSWFGRYVESKLSELDKDGKPLHTLDELLDTDTDTAFNTPEGLAAFGALFGVLEGS